ncbi:hypothetical protein [Desulfocicer niacini]
MKEDKPGRAGENPDRPEEKRAGGSPLFFMGGFDAYNSIQKSTSLCFLCTGFMPGD